MILSLSSLTLFDLISSLLHVINNMGCSSVCGDNPQALGSGLS